MAVAALITWVITAGFGSWMLFIWTGRGGHRRGDEGLESHLPATRVFSHFLLAVLGLIVWIVYLVGDSSTLAWIAFVDLVLIALLGGVLVARWSRDRGRLPAPSDVASTSTQLAEQHIPVTAVALHGVFAVATLVLVLLSALEVGGS
jgi:hypothetical protein